MALVTAGAYLRKTVMTFQQYLDAYEQRWQVDRRRPLRLLEYQDRTLYTTWDLSYSRLEQKDPAAAQLLRLLAYFDNQDIWYELMGVATTESLPSSLGQIIANQLDFENMAMCLVDYCFLEIQSTTRSYSMHNCVHDWTLGGLNARLDEQLYWYAFDCVALSTGYDNWDTLSHPKYARLTPHAARLAHSRFTQDQILIRANETRLNHVFRIAELLRQQLKYLSAEYVYQQALAGYGKLLGPEHNLTLDTAHNLGLLYADQGKLVEAEQLYERALAGYEKVLGPEHMSTLHTINNLGLLYAHQGRPAEAEQMYERALGTEHTSTLHTVNNLGTLYANQGKLAEAKQLYERALAGYEKALGLEHMWTLHTVHNLGSLYAHQSKVVEAEQMYKRALAGKEAILGPEHPSTLNTIHNLGLLYAAQDKGVKVEHLHEQVLAGYERVPGPEHTSTSIMDTVNKLGNPYDKQGTLAEAEQMFKRALAGKETTLGPEHPSTLDTVYNLGLLYAEQGKLVEAEQMYLRVQAGCETALHPDHPRTLQQVLNYADLAFSQQKVEKAKQIYQQIAAISARSLLKTASPSQAMADIYGQALHRTICATSRTDIDAQNHLLALIQHVKKHGGILVISSLARALLYFGADESVRGILLLGARYGAGAGQHLDLSGVRCDSCHHRLNTEKGMHACRQCIDTDLCDACMALKQANKILLPMCQHPAGEYYDFGSTLRQALNSDKPVDISEMDAFIDGLEQKYQNQISFRRG